MRRPVKIIAVLGLIASLALWVAARNYKRIFHPDWPKTVAELDLRYAVFAVRVEDAIARLPISGVEVSPICLGGTPYERATYLTDAEGKALVHYFEHTQMVPAKFAKLGYETVTAGLWTNSLVASLKRIP